jgi:hypothetical protein
MFCTGLNTCRCDTESSRAFPFMAPRARDLLQRKAGRQALCAVAMQRWDKCDPSRRVLLKNRGQPCCVLCLAMCRHCSLMVGPDSSVGIATSYWLNGSGIESWWGRNIPHPFRPALGSTQPPIQWVPGYSRG